MSQDSVIMSQDNVSIPYPQRGRRNAYAQVLRLQDLMMHDAESTKCTISQRAMIARSYAVLEEEKRKLKMRPLPKPIDVSKPDKRKRHAPILTAPTETPPQDHHL